MYLDANNLYSWVMTRYLPNSKIKWLQLVLVFKLRYFPNCCTSFLLKIIEQVPADRVDCLYLSLLSLRTPAPYVITTTSDSNTRSFFASLV